jgi:hypothetical protein
MINDDAGDTSDHITCMKTSFSLFHIHSRRYYNYDEKLSADLTEEQILNTQNL